MSHLDEGRLILLYYGEAPAADREHAQACAACGAACQALSRDLDAVAAEDAPPRGPGFEADLWARLAPRLRREAASGRPRRPQAWTFAALAASLAVAFVLGRASAPRTALPSPAAADPGARERIVVVAVGDHLERSAVFLVELANADPATPAGTALQGESAQALLTENRLVRQSAALTGDTGATDVLEELERVLAEVAHAAASGNEADLATVRQRIEKRGLLFKVRVLGARARGPERPEAAPRPLQAL